MSGGIPSWMLGEQVGVTKDERGVYWRERPVKPWAKYLVCAIHVWNSVRRAVHEAVQLAKADTMMHYEEVEVQ